MNRDKRIVIIGAGGHGRVAADIAGKTGYEQIIFLDDADIPAASGRIDTYTHYLDQAVFFVAIGNNKVRRRIQSMLQENGAIVVSLIHPNAVVSEDVTVGRGTVVMAGAVVNTGTVLGEGVIVNTCASVDHDCTIGSYVHVAVGAHVCGTVEIGERTWIGAGATVINNVEICADCMIGAGAVVIRSVDDTGTYIGVPARKIDR